MKTRIFNLIILDESGSMQSIRKETVESVNETVETIRKAQLKHDDQQHFVSLVTFNDEVTEVYDCVPVEEIRPLDYDAYRPACWTALYDVMGLSLNKLRRKVGADDRVLVTVVTDGCENASREYDGRSIKALVDELKAAGWVFAYIGANQDVEAVAATISITNVMSFQATSSGTRAMSARVDQSRARFFDRLSARSFDAGVENGHFFDEDI